MLTIGKWIAAGAVAAALILTFGDGIYDRQQITSSQWYLVNKFTGQAVHICDRTGCVTVQEYERWLATKAEEFRQQEAERKAEQERWRVERERRLEESNRLVEERWKRERQEAHARWTKKLIEHGLTPDQAEMRIQEHLSESPASSPPFDFWIDRVPEVVEKRREEMDRRVDVLLSNPVFERLRESNARNPYTR